jgi:hypothetical protein
MPFFFNNFPILVYPVGLANGFGKILPRFPYLNIQNTAPKILIVLIGAVYNFF